ncbi:P-loop containing nucleoside triphosphate hydrolase protein, partial [Aureobasidium melanogenum]|uniref:RNA helicase n=1 Tax=Aureobasidium melanogenum (strain CBS 110374) TaxID=1043003 RepID=A0A074VQC9_AURM1
MLSVFGGMAAKVGKMTGRTSAPLDQHQVTEHGAVDNAEHGTADNADHGTVGNAEQVAVGNAEHVTLDETIQGNQRNATADPDLGEVVGENALPEIDFARLNFRHYNRMMRRMLVELSASAGGRRVDQNIALFQGLLAARGLPEALYVLRRLDNWPGLTERVRQLPSHAAAQDAAQDTAAQDAAQDTAAQDTAAQDTATLDAAQDTAAQDTAAQDTAAQDTATLDADEEDGAPTHAMFMAPPNATSTSAEWAAWEQVREAQRLKLSPMRAKFLDSLNIDDADDNVTTLDTMKGHLDPVVYKRLSQLGYVKLWKPQRNLITSLKRNSHTITHGCPGMGKSLASAMYAVNAVSAWFNEHPEQRLRRQLPAMPLVVIIVPSHELGVQVLRDCQDIASGKDIDVKIAAAYGGADYAENYWMIEKGCDILVGSPGRITHLLADGAVVFSRTTTIIVDESNSLVSSQNTLRHVNMILYHPSTTEQTMFHFIDVDFTQDAREIVCGLARNAKANSNSIRCTTYGFYVRETIDVDEWWRRIPLLEKEAECVSMVVEEQSKFDSPDATILILVQRKVSTTALADALTTAGVVRVAATSSNESQINRQSIQDSLIRGDIKVVVATYGTFSRGLNIPGLAFIIHYDVPDKLYMYSHSSARVGRDGGRGKIVNFVSTAQDAEVMQSYIDNFMRAKGTSLKVDDETIPWEDKKAARFARAMYNAREPQLTVEQAITEWNVYEAKTVVRMAGRGRYDASGCAAPEIAVPEIAVPEIAVPDIAAPDIAAPDIAAVDGAGGDHGGGNNGRGRGRGRGSRGRGGRGRGGHGAAMLDTVGGDNGRGRGHGGRGRGGRGRGGRGRGGPRNNN